MQGKPLLEEAEIRNRLGNKSKFADRIIVPKIKGVTKMAIIASSFTALVVVFFMLFNPMENKDNLAKSDKKIITKEHTYDTDKTNMKELTETNVLLDDKDDMINKDHIPILRLTEDELKKLDIYLSDEGIEFTIESIWYPVNYRNYLSKENLKKKQYPKKMDKKIIRISSHTADYDINKELRKYEKWNLSESAGYYPIWHDYYWKDNDGKFGIGHTDFLQSPLIEKLSWGYLINDIKDLSKSYASKILGVAKTKRKDGFDINTTEYFNSQKDITDNKYQHILAKDAVPLYINNSVQNGTEHHLLWYLPTKEFVERLPERYQHMIRKRYDLIEDKYVVPSDIRSKYEDRWSAQNQKREKENFVPQTIAGIEKLELTWDELEKIGIKVEDGMLSSVGQEIYTLAGKPQEYIDILKKHHYPTDIDTGIFRIKTIIDTTSYEMEHIDPLDYDGWSMENASRIMPVAITSHSHRHIYDSRYDKYVTQIRTTEYIEDKSPLLAQYSDSNDLLNWNKEGFQSKLKLLIPVNIELGDENAKDSSMRRKAKINYWFFATEEFVELLPDRYRIPIMEELKMISSVEEGSMSYEEACSALKGESYFGLCNMESENIKNLKIYPNPSFDGEFNLRFDLLKQCELSFDLYSTDGEKIANLDGMLNEKKYNMLLILELGDTISNGVYLLSISTDLGDRITTKIILER